MFAPRAVSSPRQPEVAEVAQQRSLTSFLRDLAYVRDFSVTDCADSAGGHSNNRECVAGETGEFHFIAGALVMNQNYGPDIARLQSVFRQVSRQYN
jgi:hypothetical protein